MNNKSPDKKTIRDSIRASVPDGKLKGARIVLSDKPGHDIGGFTQYDRRKGVVKIGAPSGMRAGDIAVRGHETRHATHHGPPKRKLATPQELIAGQMVDDVNIESKPLPVGARGLTEYRRAHLATAKRDIQNMKRAQRRVKAGTEKDSVQRRNADLLCSTRALSMLKNYAGDFRQGVVKARGIRQIREVIGADSLRAINQVIEVAKKRRKRATAISMLVTLLEAEPVNEYDDPPEGKPGEPDSDELGPVRHGESLEGHMEVLDLRPKSVFCAKEKSISVKYAPDGVIINPTRFIAAITTGDANGLFSRRLRQKPGGTVVIDASGSMGANKRNLAELCKLVPTATVGYYSGNEHAKGILAIYALEGKRYNGELPGDTLRGGNSVDLAAIKWLMAHPKPWIFVSDMEFCGGTLGSELVARALVERATQRGDMELHRSLQAAFEHFGGKGELPGRFDE